MQLKNLINRTNVPFKPKSDMNACEDFLELIMVSHILVAGMELLQMTSLEDDVHSPLLPLNFASQRVSKKREILTNISQAIVNQYTNLDILHDKPQTKKSSSSELHPKESGSSDRGKKKKESVDGVYEYARETLTLSLLYEEFHDSIREGDGPRDIRCWKFLLLAFKASRRKNYAIEAFTLLAQEGFLFPERLKQQLLWSRFVNTVGKPGHNISCDLYLEHCNRLVKTAVNNLGANVTPKAITRISKCAGPLMKVCQQYDRNTFVATTLSGHTAASFKSDLEKVICELVTRSKVFQYKSDRRHSTFRKHARKYSQQSEQRRHCKVDATTV